jgi:hypothetical protein
MEQEQQQEEQVTETVVDETPQVSFEADSAKLRGWLPKEEFEAIEGNKGKTWVPADEFLRRGELIERIEGQSKELKNLRKALSDLSSLHSKVREVEYQRALNELKAQKKEALSVGDADRILEIDDKIDAVKEEMRESKQDAVTVDTPVADVPPVFKAWMDRNQWYLANPKMRAFADGFGMSLKATNPTMSPEQILVEVEKEVKEKYMSNPNRTKPSPVDGGGSTTTTKKANGSGDVDLTPEEREVMRTLVRGGHITQEQYMKDIKAIRAAGEARSSR